MFVMISNTATIATEMDAQHLRQLMLSFHPHCGKQLRAGYTFSSNTCSCLLPACRVESVMSPSV